MYQSIAWGILVGRLEEGELEAFAAAGIEEPTLGHEAEVLGKLRGAVERVNECGIAQHEGGDLGARAVVHAGAEVFRREEEHPHLGKLSDGMSVGGGAVAGRGRAEPSDAALPEVGGGDARHAVLRRAGRQDRFILKVQARHAEQLAQRPGVDTWCVGRVPLDEVLRVAHGQDVEESHERVGRPAERRRLEIVLGLDQRAAGAECGERLGRGLPAGHAAAMDGFPILHEVAISTRCSAAVDRFE